MVVCHTSSYKVGSRVALLLEELVMSSCPAAAGLPHARTHSVSSTRLRQSREQSELYKQTKAQYCENHLRKLITASVNVSGLWSIEMK